MKAFLSVTHSREEAVPAAGLQGKQFRYFTVLWSLATLFHMAYSNAFDDSIHHIFLSVAAVFLFFRPGHLTGFFALILLQLADVIFYMPGISNHWLFTAFVNLSILHAALYLVIKKKQFSIDKGELYDVFGRMVRIEVVILYFYAVFQKLNAGFFTPETSCASVLLDAQNLDWLFPVTPQMKFINAYFTLFIEGLIPVLLCIRKTRNFGILVGLVFHCILGYSSFNAYYDFSSMVFALYFLFAPASFSRFLSKIVGSIRASSLFQPKFSYRKLVLVMGTVAAVVGAVLILSKKLPDYKSFHLYLFWTVYSTLFILLFLAYMLSDKTPRPQLSFALPQWSLAILPVIVFLNGLSPYLGLKTENSYAMFSNLRTEGGISNHYIMPASLQIFDFQKDLIEIVSSTDPVLAKIANENKLMVYFSFKEIVAIRRPQRVEYLLNGQPKLFDLQTAIETNDPLLKKNSLLLRNLFAFRLINKYDPQPCAH
ncbi:hypothetical protein HRG84_01190 [Flavisolibacter sp. BT320]|nr:hypothetical protein [Flavisolibacter longurius]